ncbi:hypothetical protein [Cytobacillus dafuensis]|uniref:Uncharacterized protein n=1 Tax=Cytobacillus dafuensis TaxID=1742359 RepID=A0A5B8Z137_CYTDA|nr:hypothetical protein [Cytobacillus dafuensis]QED46680.1 hypothetical protein FSZ17_04975 [Cytobacillus dafuensis]
MNNYHPYYQNYINPYYQNGTSGQRDLSAIELVNPDIIQTREGRIVDYTHFTITDAKGYEKKLNMKGANPRVMPWTRVFVSIAELDGNNNPFIGLASMEVHNVVPYEDYIIVRGYIGWEKNLKARLSIHWMN